MKVLKCKLEYPADCSRQVLLPIIDVEKSLTLGGLEESSCVICSNHHQLTAVVFAKASCPYAGHFVDINVEGLDPSCFADSIDIETKKD